MLINPSIRGARQRQAITETARQVAEGDTEGEGPDLDPVEAHLVRVVEYDVPDRDGGGAGELIVVLSTICDPGAAALMRLVDLVPAAVGPSLARHDA